MLPTTFPEDVAKIGWMEKTLTKRQRTCCVSVFLFLHFFISAFLLRFCVSALLHFCISAFLHFCVFRILHFVRCAPDVRKIMRSCRSTIIVKKPDLLRSSMAAVKSLSAECPQLAAGYQCCSASTIQVTLTRRLGGLSPALMDNGLCFLGEDGVRSTEYGGTLRTTPSKLPRGTSARRLPVEYYSTASASRYPLQCAP